MGAIVQIINYQIELLSETCVGGMHKFRYQVTALNPPAAPEPGDPLPQRGISNVAIALCAPSIHNVTTFNPGPPVGDVNTVGMPCLKTPPAPIPAPPQQIKFNVSDNNLPFIFEFVLDGCFVVDNIDIALHTGGGCYYRKILGPTCNLISSKGIDFSKINIRID